MNEREFTEPKPTIKEPTLFSMYRGADASGVSGTGRVLDGALFHNGYVVICWRTDVDGAKHGRKSLGIYPSWEDFEFLHITSHPTNDTEIKWWFTELDDDEDDAQAESDHLAPKE